MGENRHGRGWASIDRRGAEKFSEEWEPHAEELKRRMLFAIDPDGVPVGTVAAWNWLNNRNVAAIQWFSVIDSEQGKGLGGALLDAARRSFGSAAKVLYILRARRGAIRRSRCISGAAFV